VGGPGSSISLFSFNNVALHSGGGGGGGGNSGGSSTGGGSGNVAGFGSAFSSGYGFALGATNNFGMSGTTTLGSMPVHTFSGGGTVEESPEVQASSNNAVGVNQGTTAGNPIVSPPRGVSLGPSIDSMNNLLGKKPGLAPKLPTDMDAK